jgi:ankyrin repeat protein
MLIDAGASVNAAKSWRGETGITALHLAAEAGHTEVVRLLLERCANASSAKRSGWTALHWAAQNGSLDIMRILLQHGADVLAVASYDDHRNCQPIHQAAQHGRTQAVELLLKHG